MAAKLDARPPGRHEPRDPELDQFMVGLVPSHPRFINPPHSSLLVHRFAATLTLFILISLPIISHALPQEAYCNMLVKYREELTRPIDEAMEFLKRVEAQLDSISGGGSSSARFSLTGKIKIATSSDRRRSSSRSIVLLCFIFLLLARSLPSLLLLLHGGGTGVFIYTGVERGLPHWVWLLLDSGGGCSGSLPL